MCFFFTNKQRMRCAMADHFFSLRAGPPGMRWISSGDAWEEDTRGIPVNRLETVGLTCHTVDDRHYDRFKTCEDGRFGRILSFSFWQA